MLDGVASHVGRLVTRARSEQTARALGAAAKTLADVLAIDPGNAAADAMLQAVEADRREAANALKQAKDDLAGKRYDQAERAAKRARELDVDLAAEARSLEGKIAAGRPPKGGGGGGQDTSADKILAQASSALQSGDLATAQAKAREALAKSPQLKSAADALREDIARQEEKAEQALQDARMAVAAGLFDRARDRAGDASRLNVALAGDANQVDRDIGAAEADIAKLKLRFDTLMGARATSDAQQVLADLRSRWKQHPLATSMQSELDAATGDLARAGFVLYFQGEVDACIRRLEAALEKQPERADVLAVLGSAFVTRALLGTGDASAGDISRAKELFRRARQAQPDLKLDPRFFSPRIVELFDEAG